MFRRLPVRGLVVFLAIVVFASIGYVVLHSSHAATNADINGDGVVDVKDLSVLASHYGTTSGNSFSTGDLNGDGSVNVFDFSILASNWGGSSAGGLVTTRFNSASPLNTPIPTNPVIDSASASIISTYVAPNQASGAVYDYGQTFIYSSASDPTYNFSFSEPWGSNPFNAVVTTSKGQGSCNPLHVPNNTSVPVGSDGWVHIIDSTKPGLECAIWQATKASGTWAGSWGGVFDVNGDGVHVLAGSGTGSNIIGGQILASEVASGNIPHALGFAFGCNDSTSFRYPATKTDGKCGVSPLQEGMRFQLDPTYNCLSLPTKAEQMVCVALQKYGAYNVDTSGNAMGGFGFETDDRSDPADSPWQKPGTFARSGGIYGNVGIPNNGCGNCAGAYYFPDIPMNKMRVLAHWDGS